MKESLLDHLKRNWKVLVLGQGLSFLLASAGAAQATLHLRCGLSAPNFTTSLVYLGLAVIYLPILVCRRLWRRRRRRQRRAGDRVPIRDFDEKCSFEAAAAAARETGDGVHRAAADDNDDDDDDDDAPSPPPPPPLLSWSLRWYLTQAFFDVEANAVTMLAFRYTTLTSVTLFDALAIPASMVISRFVFFRSSRRYRIAHYVGVLVCMVGVVLNLYQDYESDGHDDDAKGYPHKMWGDACAITGGILFGLNDVLTEVTVGRSGDTTEYLAVVGIFGFLIAFLQSLAFEREEVRKFFAESDGFDGDGGAATCSVDGGFLLLFAFVGVTICSYVGGTHFLVLSEAAFFNLSLLTGDLWSVLFSVAAERIVPRPLFFAALATVLSGVAIYEMAPSPALEKKKSGRDRDLAATRSKDDAIFRGSAKGVDDDDDGGIIIAAVRGGGGGYDSIDSETEADADTVVELKRITIC